jgi:rubrerythrin
MASTLPYLKAFKETASRSSVVEKAEDYLTSAKISREKLYDKLSEFLAVEKGGLKLYEEALRILTDQEVAKKFRTFKERTRKHESILIRVVQELGMDPAYVSSGAKVATEKAEALLKTMTTGFTGKPAELNAVEKHHPSRDQRPCGLGVSR